MPNYAIHYKHTEHRVSYIEAADIGEAVARWKDGMADRDEFRATGNDQHIVNIDEEQDGKGWHEPDTTWLSVWTDEPPCRL